MSYAFAADVLEETLASMRNETGLPLTEEQVDTIWDCDWEDEICPVCGHNMDNHNPRTITRCANTR